MFAEIAKRSSKLEWNHLHIGEFDVVKNSIINLNLRGQRLPIIRIYHGDNIVHVESIDASKPFKTLMHFIVDHSR